MTKRPTQREIQPANAIEEFYLQQSGFYGHHDNIFIEDLAMNSAIADLNLLDIHELGWPSKEVLKEVKVQHCLPNSDTLRTDTVTRKMRVPMTPQEAADYYREKAEALVGKPKKKSTTKKAKA